MSGILMMVIAIVVLGGAYLLYGRYLQNKRGIDPKAKTPAYELEDGVDYVPADTNVVFGHQFASIAGAGPINGPIQAAIFGWLPVLLWIPMVFMMAVTFTALIKRACDLTSEGPTTEAGRSDETLSAHANAAASLGLTPECGRHNQGVRLVCTTHRGDSPLGHVPRASTNNTIGSFPHASPCRPSTDR